MVPHARPRNDSPHHSGAGRVKIFFFTTVFAASVGGIERVAEILCREFVAQGDRVRLAR